MRLGSLTTPFFSASTSERADLHAQKERLDKRITGVRRDRVEPGGAIAGEGGDVSRRSDAGWCDAMSGPDFVVRQEFVTPSRIAVDGVNAAI